MDASAELCSRGKPRWRLPRQWRREPYGEIGLRILGVHLGLRNPAPLQPLPCFCSNAHAGEAARLVRASCFGLMGLTSVPGRLLSVTGTCPDGNKDGTKGGNRFLLSARIAWEDLNVVQLE